VVWRHSPAPSAGGGEVDSFGFPGASSCSSAPCPGALRGRHSFPTRRSSDLIATHRYGDSPFLLVRLVAPVEGLRRGEQANQQKGDRKSTRLNSSHGSISYAVFCLK